MPMHDWTLVDAGIFHPFHHMWIASISMSLNDRILPDDYYALPKQQAANFGPDELTLQGQPRNENRPRSGPVGSPGPDAHLLTRPQTRFTAESDAEFYRRKKSSVVVRHVSGDRVVAVVEIVSPGNKTGRHPFRAFVDKACELLEARIHLLILDPFPPGPRDPNGVHAAIWEEIRDDPFRLLPDKPLTLAAYECELVTRAYIEPIAVGDPLPDMPLFLEPDGCVSVPLEATYETAFAALPRRWRTVLEPPSAGQ